MFELKNVSKFYQTNGVVSSALHHINLSLSKGEIVAITGESGSGKSTLLNVITKMDNFDEGEIYFYGNETSYFSINDMDDFRKNKVGFIFQNYNIIDSYTVLENVMLPLLLKGMQRQEAKKRAIELISEVGLSHRIKNRGIKLSGGEKQRCVIARALASDCEILACDEPTGNLDAKTAADIISLIKRVSKDKLVLIVTHDYEQVQDIVTRKIKIMDGEIIEDTKAGTALVEDNQELNLDYQPQSKKVSLCIAKNNLLYTPKKTLLVGAILLVICLFVLFLYQTIYSSFREIDDGSQIPYQGEDKMLVSAKSKGVLKEEDILSLSDHSVFNRFYEKHSLYFQSNDYVFAFPAYYEPRPSELKMDEGRLPNALNEVGLLIPDESNSYGVDSRVIDKVFSLSIYDESNVFNFKIVGYQKRKDVTAPVFFGNEELEKRFRCSAINDLFKIAIEYKQYHTDLTGTVRMLRGEGKTRLIVPDNYENVKFSSISDFKNYSLSLDSIPIEKYSEQSGFIPFSPIIIYGDDEPFMEEKYEAYVYGDIDRLSKKATNLNLNVINFATFTDTQPLFIFLMNLQIYVLILLSSLVIIVIYFITYIILSRIYQARKKDYTVLRTLGVTKRDMKSVVTFEVMIQTILMAIFVYLVCFILGKTVSKLYIFSKIPFYITILYFVVMLLFGYIMARRFNRRLFKYSVNQTFKSEVN